jgi:magnesium transporter
MISRYRHGELVWIDLESPTSAEAREVLNEFEIAPEVAEELLLPSIKPRVDFYGTHMYLVLHFPALRHTHRLSSEQEVDFIIGRNFIITTHYDTVDPLHKFSKVFEVNSIIDRSNIGEHAGFIFYYMVKKLYRSIEHELEVVRDTLEDAEERIFEGQERDMVRNLSFISRDLLNMRQALSPQREILASFAEIASAFFEGSFDTQLRAIQNEHMRIFGAIKTNASWLIELRETNNSLVSTKQNEVMKVLTIMAFVTFPLSLVASIFGMNTQYLPIVGQPYDFWIIVGAMFIGMIVFLAFFKYKRWL